MSTSFALADTFSQQDLLALGRVEYFHHRRQWEAAAAELGRLPKSSQDSPAVKRYLNTVVSRLFEPERPSPPAFPAVPAADSASGTAGAGRPEQKGPRVTVQSRTTHRRMDADSNSDQIFDDHGWQYNTLWMAEANTGPWRHTLRGAVDGFQDGKNDVRPRQFSYQARREGILVTTGDIRNYLTLHKTFDPSNPLIEHTGYTLRSTQLRGVDLRLLTETNDVHLMAGVAPYFRSASDEYLYPRQIYGLRESHRFAPWYRAGIGGSYVRDRIEAMEHIDTAIQPRETGIVSLEQDLTVIPGHWEINTENAYSVSDDHLKPDRFGNNVKLKGFAHHLYSEWRWAPIRVIGMYERIGPDFRAPSDVAAVGTINSKNVSADREHWTLRVYPRRLGPLFGDLLYSRTQNNLDNDSEVEMTREHWVSAQGGLQLPRAWPQPGGRATFTRTVSVPGSRFSAEARWVYDLSSELRKRWGETEWTAGARYWQTANDAGTGFDDEYRRTYSAQAGRRLWPGGYASARGAWTRAQDLFDNVDVQRRTEQEANVTASSRLWSTASLTAGYTYRDLGAPTVVDGGLQTARGGIIHTVSSTFVWPYTKRLRHDRTFQVIPALQFHYSAGSDALERHPDLGGRLTVRYAVRDAWRWEFLLEHRQDDDAEIPQVRSQEWRAWLLVTSTFGRPLRDESPLR